jgi:type 1 glutamine amidotransferase
MLFSESTKAHNFNGTIQMKCLYSLLIVIMLSQTCRAERLKALIVDGQNNHAQWPKITAMLRSYLIESGRFDVDVARTRFTWNGGDLIRKFPLDDGQTYEVRHESDPDFKPQFSNYDVVISNFGHDAAPWPDETKRAFEEYVREGGGFVVIHAANNSFGDWGEFNRIIGLGGWGGRNEHTGPYVYLNEAGEAIRDDTPGPGGAHGPQHEFQIVVRDGQHPIMQGLPSSWKHSQDELYQSLRGPAENMTILATAYADREFKGSGNHEPMIMTVDYGKGRVYHTPMGHADYSIECVGFITTFLRGTEWAATGDVTLTDVPDDFPTTHESSKRIFSVKVPQ